MEIIPTQTFLNLSIKKQERILEASINEFSKRNYEQAKLSNIIKESNIPRGSFYQYFEDKKDLYLYLFDRVAQKKIQYMGDLIPNPDKIPFLTLFFEMYKRGAMFAIENPKFIKITANLLSSKGDIYNELIGNNMNIAKQFYIGYINQDKELGRIREDIDSEVLAELVINMTTNIAIDNFVISDSELQLDKMIEKIEKTINIFKKGIQTGE